MHLKIMNTPKHGKKEISKYILRRYRKSFIMILYNSRRYKSLAQIYYESSTIDWIFDFAFIFSTKEVSNITGREISTIRWAKKNGSLFGVKIHGKQKYNMWEIKKAFPQKKRKNRTWTDNEIHELITTGDCKGRSKSACKTMRSKLINGLR